MGKLRINMNREIREIKFRIWDKQENSFYSEEYLKHFNVAVSWDGGTIYQNFISGDREVGNEVIVQQYTGLKDKNEKDIYEGDIVKATSDQYINENFVGKVIFDEGYFLTWINKNDIRGLWGEDDIEVIGNIFENKDLLEKEL